MMSHSSSDAVVLLHGLAANRLAMLRLAKHLDAHGYVVQNWGYPSITTSIETHAREFRNRLSDFSAGHPFGSIHLVTHSMGGIVARRALSLSRPPNLGRFVMLGPPNSGSHVARRMARPLRRLCPPLQELSDAPDSYVNGLEEPRGIEVGIIAAAADRVVKLPSTHLECQRDHIVLPGHHGVLPWRRETSEQVLHFLLHGHFDREVVQEPITEGNSKESTNLQLSNSDLE